MKYHSTLPKSALMKILKLDSVAHDLDEVTASPLGNWKRPWWVRTVDKPTVEIDWDRLQSFDERNTQQVSFAKYVGDEENKRLRRLKIDKTKEWILEGRKGYRLPERALDIAVRQGAVGNSFLGFADDPSHVKDGWGGVVFNPASIGVPKYDGTPEENSRIVRSAMRMFGASQVAFLELDEKNKKFIYTYDSDGKKIDFEDVEKPYETIDRRVIPNRFRSVIVFTVEMSEELLKRRNGRAPTPLSASATGSAYARARVIIDDTQVFLHVLGYQGLMTVWFNGLGCAPALGIMAGIGEQSRLNRLISPEHGPLIRIFRIITDLPLAPSKPIDAGIMRFCKTCKICANECPSGTLSKDTEPTWEVKGPWNNPGHKAYFEDSIKCMQYWLHSTASCSTCFAVCPFSNKNKSFIHTFVMATLAKTPILNGTFTKMDSIMGYDKPRNPEEWWNLDLPPYGIDSARGTQLE
ncbi:MAG: reductive dehalogenase [Chloroflexi bacterium]|nr:reductive dehalogenase [Chloroflexota bacterium]